MTRRSEDQNDLLTEKCPTRFIDLNAVMPDRYSFSKKYWHVPIEVREIVWLNDQNRLDDAIVFFTHRLKSVSMYEIPFLGCGPEAETLPSAEEVIGRLCWEGKLQKVKRTRSMYSLGPNSGIEAILRDVAFFQEPPNPAYGFTKEDLDEASGG